MIGWLPFAETLNPTRFHEDPEEEDDDDIFDSHTDDRGGSASESGDGERAGRRPMPLYELQRNATNTARDIACLPSLDAAQDVLFPRTPIFLGHGRNDEKVQLNLGRQAKDVLEALGCKSILVRLRRRTLV